jgi:ABC-type transporter Mla subunit MlaD
VKLFPETPLEVPPVRGSRLRWRNLAVGLTVLAGFAGAATIILLLAPGINSKPSHRLILRACFHDAEGLLNNARVRLAGVDVGYVRRVRAMPRSPHCPAEVQMILETDYELRIPEDSLVDIGRDGLLGAKYIEIDASKANGPTAVDGSILKAVEPGTITPEQWFKVLQRLAQAPIREEKKAGKAAPQASRKIAQQHPSPSRAE